MKDIILLVHIFFGILVVASTITKFVTANRVNMLGGLMQKSSFVVVGLSSVGLVATGASLGRTCVGALSLVVFVLVAGRVKSAIAK